jgi:hypothetical protein
MKQPENGIHGFAVTVNRLKHRARTAFLGGRSMDAGLIAAFNIAGMQPAGNVNRPTISLTGGMRASLGRPAVDSLTALTQLDNGGFELVQHLPALHKKFINNFSLF